MEAAAITGKQKTPEKLMLHSFAGVKIQDIPPLRRRGRTDMYGHPSVFLPLPMSCSAGMVQTYPPMVCLIPA